MTVNQVPIFAGWFSIFAIDGANNAFDYVLAETGQTIYKSELHIATVIGGPAACATNPMNGGCSVWHMSGSPQWKFKVVKPPSYNVYSNSSGVPVVQGNGTTEYVIGFFGDLATSSYAVCYPQAVYEALPGLYAGSDLVSNTLMATPLDIDFTGSGSDATMTAKYAGGGTATVVGNLYTNSAGGLCVPATSISVNHTLLAITTKTLLDFNHPGRWCSRFHKVALT